MNYLGSKKRLAGEIIPIITANRTKGQTYVEPFVGGANVLCGISGPRIANDIHFHLIEMYKALQTGWEPPNSISIEEYKYYKDNQLWEDPALVGFVGFGCSFGNKYFGGYAKNSEGRNYASVIKRQLTAIVKNIQDVDFQNVDYRGLKVPPNSIVYCDPPYKNTVGYCNGINHDDLFDWIRNLSLIGCEIYLSEYEAPEDFDCVFEKTQQLTLNKNKKDSRTEKLFKFNEFY